MPSPLPNLEASLSNALRQHFETVLNEQVEAQLATMTDTIRKRMREEVGKVVVRLMDRVSMENYGRELLIRVSTDIPLGKL
jgi:hypothetical protein